MPRVFSDDEMQGVCESRVSPFFASHAPQLLELLRTQDYLVDGGQARPAFSVQEEKDHNADSSKSQHSQRLQRGKNHSSRF